MTKTRKILRSLVLVGVVGAVATAGAFSAFSSQTDNPNNTITAGTVSIEDNDSGGALYSIAAAKPSDPKENCIEVKYTGSLPADVNLYRVPGALGSLGAQASAQTGRCMTATSRVSRPRTRAATRPPQAWTVTGISTRRWSTA
jgi:predicted ribosomally synthesized peptide with SipW-like signal peptide